MTLAKPLAVAIALGLGAMTAHAASYGPTHRPNVLEVASTAGTFETLLIAANNAGLIGRLADPVHRVTVLAPTDAAFAKLPTGTVDYLLRPENKDKLAQLVNNHIIAGGVLSANFEKDALNLPALSGQTVKLEGDHAGQAKIEYADVIASNGVIHVIDRVLVPTATN